MARRGQKRKQTNFRLQDEKRAALGMLSTIATAIDAYRLISDNTRGIAEVAGMSHRIRERTDALDAAGNTTATIGKGFAIRSAAFVSLAFFFLVILLVEQEFQKLMS